MAHFLLQCPAYQLARREILGENPTLYILQSNPQDVIDYLRRVARR